MVPCALEVTMKKGALSSLPKQKDKPLINTNKKKKKKKKKKWILIAATTAVNVVLFCFAVMFALFNDNFEEENISIMKEHGHDHHPSSLVVLLALPHSQPTQSNVYAHVCE